MQLSSQTSAPVPATGHFPLTAPQAQGLVYSPTLNLGFGQEIHMYRPGAPAPTPASFGAPGASVEFERVFAEARDDRALPGLSLQGAGYAFSPSPPVAPSFNMPVFHHMNYYGHIYTAAQDEPDSRGPFSQSQVEDDYANSFTSSTMAPSAFIMQHYPTAHDEPADGPAQYELALREGYQFDGYPLSPSGETDSSGTTDWSNLTDASGTTDSSNLTDSSGTTDSSWMADLPGATDWSETADWSGAAPDGGEGPSRRRLQ